MHQGVVPVMAKNESSLVPLIALGANLLIAVAKYGAAFLTGSSSMMSEAVHSTVDTGNEVLLLIGVHRAKRPPDEGHPFGYGMEVYFWSMLMAVMLFGLGAGASFLDGIQQIQKPEAIEEPLISFGVLGISAVAEGTSWVFSLRSLRRSHQGKSIFRAVRRSKNPSVFAVLFEDTAALLGIAAAAVGIGLSLATGDPVWDGAGSILIALLLAAAGLLLARECHGLLVGESALPEVRDDVRRTVESWPGVAAVGELATLQTGPESVLVTMSLDFEDRFTSSDVERAVSDIERRLKSRHEQIKRVFVEAQSVEPHNRRRAQGGSR